MMRDERNEDKPPYSRVFVVCDRQMQKTELKVLFEKYGDIESVHMPTDRHSGESKGIAYIKFARTSAAAAAIEGLHLKHIQSNNKPLKVIVATTKNEEKNENEDKYKRLFIKVPKDATEKDIRAEFGNYGNVEHVHIQRDRETSQSRGFAYVHYRTFYEAAIAYEECEKKYKPVFATPKEELKRSRTTLEPHDWYPSNDSIHTRDPRHDSDSHYRDPFPTRDHGMVNKSILPLIKTEPNNYDTVIVSCNQFIPQWSIESLFSIIPGMTQIKYVSKPFEGAWSATVKYESKVAAAHSVASINNYEFPSGEVLSVKPQNALSDVASSLSQIVNTFKTSIDSNSDLKHLAEAIAQASTLLQVATSGIDSKKDSFNEHHCSVPLPSLKPRVEPGTPVVERCFLVFKPHPPPVHILNDIFCRFGDFIEVNVFPNKTYGFAKYASARAAQEAIKTLHNCTIRGIHMKVLEAEDMRKNAKDKMGDDDDNEFDRKRAKIDEN